MEGAATPRELRPAAPDDLETLLAIQRTASVTAYAHVFPPELYPYPEDEVRELLRASLGDPAVTLLVAEDAGFVAFSAGWLRQLYVHPDAWGRGLGSRLHEAAIDGLVVLGGESAFLWVLEGNERARRFYERRGWKTDGGTRVAHFPPHPVDLRYVRTL